METHPIDLTLLSGEVTFVPDLGDFVVDVESAMFHKPRLVIDHIHDDGEVIGYCENFRTEKQEDGTIALKADGTLVPFRPDDKASEIIYKSKMGIPFEASTLLDDSKATIENIPEGETAQVNGREYNIGKPLKILRNCPIRGVTVCPYGNDLKTNSVVLKMTALSKPTESNKMSEETTPTPEGAPETKVTNSDLAEFVEQFGLEKGYQMYQSGVSLDEVKQFAELKAKLGFDEEPNAEASTASDGEPPAAAPVTSESGENKELKRLSAILEKQGKLIESQGAKLSKLSFTAPRGATEPLSSGAVEEGGEEKPKAAFKKTGTDILAEKYKTMGVVKTG